MNATLLYRIASVLLIVFAIGHTIGFLKFKPPTAEGVAVRDAMDHVRFQFKGSSFTYGGFYRGFGLFVTAYLLFAAFLSWRLGGLAGFSPQSIVGLAWAFCALHLASLALSWIYFFGPPIILSALLAVCAGWAAWLVTSAKV